MRYLATVGALFLTVLLAAQTAEFKVMTYNLLFYKDASAPCTSTLSFAQKDQAFKTVFKAISPDIMCVNELVGFADNSGANSILTNVINTDGEVNFTSAGYSNNTFSSITNMLFYDSTLFGLDGQDYILNTLNNRSLVRVIDFYRLFYKDPALQLGADTVFLTVVAAHLKAGSGTSNSNEREDAMQAAMDYLSLNVADDNVIFTGDLNLYSSTEGAYQELVNYSVASERFVDPGVAGSWHNNSTYAVLHTQSTHSFSSGCYSSGGMDDRFDFILNSQAIANGTADVAYKINSMKAIGNDGAHFNQSINSGTNSAVGSVIADALYDFSDHLPVVSEYQINLSDIGLDDNPLSEIQVINPFGDFIMINNPFSIQHLNYSLYDLAGRLVQPTLTMSHSYSVEINTRQLAQGVYLLSIGDDRGNVRVEKLVKYD